MTPTADIGGLFAQHRSHLWHLCYRMLAVPAEADDVVQDTFVRFMEKPPPDLSTDLRSWLVKVALNLSRDALRRRKRRSYWGTWLPAAVDTGGDEPPGAEARWSDVESTEGRYDLMESISLAFLTALEALTPKQRAVLLLRDVFDYSVANTAEALDMTEPAVKTTLHRARATMAEYDRTRSTEDRGVLAERTRETLGKVLQRIAMKDYDGMMDLVDEEAVAFSDGGGEFFAARIPLRGARKIVHFLRTAGAKYGDPTSLEVREINGLPAVVITLPQRSPKFPPRLIYSVQVDAQGKIIGVYSLLASAKLQAVR